MGRHTAVTEQLVVPARVLYEEPIEGPEGLRKATVKLAHRARVELDR